jgi:hypothetical protein
MNDDRLREAYERVLAERDRQPIENPVSLEEMVRALEREGPESERLDIMNRVMRHPVHRREFELLRAAHQASRPPARRSFVMPVALAAGIVLAVAIGSQLRSPSTPEPMRGDPAVPSVPLYEPPEIAVADSARAFLWANVAGARSYSFALMDLEGRSLYEVAVSDTSVALPDSVRLTPGAEYRWRVRAVTNVGEELSPMRPLRVRPD